MAEHTFSFSGEIFYCRCIGCANEVTSDGGLCFFCREAGCMSAGGCLAQDFQGLRRFNPVGRESPATKKIKMLERAAIWLEAWGYDFVTIVWEWQSRSHDIEAYKNGLLYRFYVFRAAHTGRYWLSQIAGKDICQIRTWPRVKAIFSVPKKGFYAISHREFKEQCGKSIFNLTNQIDLNADGYYP